VAHVPNRILEFLLILLILMVEPLMMRLISLRLWGLLSVVLFEVSKLTREVFGTTMSTLRWPCLTHSTVFKTGFFCQNYTALVHWSSLVDL
jgi:hypothetical protein